MPAEPNSTLSYARALKTHLGPGRTLRPEPSPTEPLFMLAEPLHPLVFEPILKSLIWGGRRLGTVLNKEIGDGDGYAESWEIADHRNDVSQVGNGRLAGLSLRDLLRHRAEELLGPGLASQTASRRGQFPLLVKFLDANDVLSVQVHPDDALGRKLANDNGKTEAWVILHAEPGSLIYAGLKASVTRETFSKAMETGDIVPLLHRFEAKAGDCVMIPAGTIHAIGAGVVLAEIQQMSDATFRVHDWGRVGPDGRARTLHPAEALTCTDFERGPVHPITTRPEPIPGGTRERLVSCPFFALERLRLRGPSAVGHDDRFSILLGLGGQADVIARGEPTRLRFGQTLLLPASLGPCLLVPHGGEAVVLSCTVP